MDLVKEEGFWEIDEEDKKLDFEVYPHMVEQLIWKIKEAQKKLQNELLLVKILMSSYKEFRNLPRYDSYHFKVHGSARI